MVPASASRLRRGYPGMLGGRGGVAPVTRRRVVRPLPLSPAPAGEILYWYVAADLGLAVGSAVTSWPSHLDHGPTLACTDLTMADAATVRFGTTTNVGAGGSVPLLGLTAGITMFVVGERPGVWPSSFPGAGLFYSAGFDYGFIVSRGDTGTHSMWEDTENFHDNGVDSIGGQVLWQLNLPAQGVLTCMETHLGASGHTLRIAGVDQAPRTVANNEFSDGLLHDSVQLNGNDSLLREVRVYDGTPDVGAVRAELAAQYAITA